jgi:replicative DNA helicase
MNKEEISTGYNNLDAAWGYLKKSQLILVASRPGMGKTTFLVNIGKRIANNHAVLLISLEQSKINLIKRYGELNFTINDSPEFNIEKLKDAIIESNCEIILIDYIQLIDGDRNSIINSLKTLAIELNVCMLITSQLSRELEYRAIDQRRPVMADLNNSVLFESDRINDFDKIIYLYADSYYLADTLKNNILEVISLNKNNTEWRTTELRISDIKIDLSE